MDNVLRLLLRFLLVPLGLVCGFIATIVVVMVGYWRIGDLLAGVDAVDAAALFDALSTATFALSAVALTMWAIALVGVLFSEAFAVRSWLFHAANGAISAWLGAQLFTPYPETPSAVPFDGDLYILGAGLAGGLTYWLVAGWSAGFWKPIFAERPPAPPPAAAPAPVSAPVSVPTSKVEPPPSTPASS